MKPYLRVALSAILPLVTPGANAMVRPAASQSAPSDVQSASLTTRAAELVAVLRTRSKFEQTFSPEFLQAIPPAQLTALATQLANALGEPRSLTTTTPRGGSAAQVVIAFERGSASLEIVIEETAPGRIVGLRVLGTEIAGETVGTVAAAFQALPGSAGFGVYALGAGKPKDLGGYRQMATAPIASTFKLWVLSALSNSVAQRRRRWGDVATFTQGPFASSALAKWPRGAPVTLHTLATMMISVSDNTAADTLMAAIGRAAVDADAAAIGVVQPVLTTAETTAIKSSPLLTERWRVASPAARRAILSSEVARLLAAGPVDTRVFASGRPVAIDTVEWFASPAQVAVTLDSFRLPEAASARTILAVSPGVPKPLADRFAYIGFKGGSEPGVIAMSFLVQTITGRWYAVVGNWHQNDQAVEDARFAALMNRALTVVASPDFSALSPTHWVK